MRAGIGKLLALIASGRAGSTWVAGAVAFVLLDPAHEWGMRLALHSDLDDETWSAWFRAEPNSVAVYPASATPLERRALEQLASRRDSLEALVRSTAEVLRCEDMRRRAAVDRATYHLESRAVDLAAGVIRGRPAAAIMRAARAEHAEAMDRAWRPIDPERAGLIVRAARAVLAELRADEVCEVCHGDGVLAGVYDADRNPAVCAACSGTGHTRYSDRQRARTLDVPFSSYQQTWKQRYDYLHNAAILARRRAVRQFREQCE